jgi:thiol-disulfide isomerase/thioredoxin
MTDYATDVSPGVRRRQALAVGLAFVVGTLVFFIVFQLVRIFGSGTHEPLTPIAERKPGGELAAQVLIPGGQGPAAIAPAATTPATWNIANERGRVVLVNYFATWCGPCMEETPDLVKIASEYAPRGVVTVAISVDQDADRAGGESSRMRALRQYVETYKVPYPILVPPEDSVLWKMDFPIPQTFLYDRQGRRARKIVGMADEASIRKSLEELLAERE